MKTEIWNGHEIRFVEKGPGEWWAVGADVAKALAYARPAEAIRKHCPYTLKWRIGVQTGIKADGTPAMQNVSVNIIPEKDIYRLIFRSTLPDAEAFQDWTFDVLKELRVDSGLEGFHIFRTIDKEHQIKTMSRLCNGLKNPVRVDFIKANVIASKAISSKHGLPKMMKKGSMTPEMLLDRQGVLDDTVTLMTANDSFGLGLRVSDIVYNKYAKSVLN